MATDGYPDIFHPEAMSANAVPLAALNLLKAFSLHVNFPELAFDDQGVCLISLGEHIVTVTVDRTGNALVLRCAVIDVPDDSDEQFFSRLLVGNFSTAFARIGALAIDAESGKIILLERLPLAGSLPADLEQAIERIANGVEFWQLNITQNASPNTP